MSTTALPPTTLVLPIEFQTSYAEFESFPYNLIYQTTYSGAIKAYKIRLDDAETLFTDEIEAYIPCRDLVGTAFTRQGVKSDVELKAWLGDRSTVDSTTRVRSATKSDPKCRFIFLGGEGTTRSRLRIHRKMLLRIFSYHQVMPAYIDLISIFGYHLDPKKLRYCGFRAQVLLANPPAGMDIPDLGRSGLQFQLSYHLRTVNCVSEKGTSKKNQKWSTRPASFHHQFDVKYGTTLWLITKGDMDDIKSQIEEVTGYKGRVKDRSFQTPVECFISSLAIHLVHCNWSNEEWRWHVESLEARVNDATGLVVSGHRDFAGGNKYRRVYSPKDLQIAQAIEEELNEAIMVLGSNVDVIVQLRKFYDDLVENVNFPLRSSCASDILIFSTQLNDMVNDLKVQIEQANLLVRTTSGRKTLILQHLQSQATEKMEDMTLSMHREAIAVKIITVVTLIYLPATFVSTFFSTDIVSYQGAGGGSFSPVAMYRWLQVTLPLTALTLILSWIAFRFERIQKKFTRPSEELPMYIKAPKNG